MYDQPDKIFVVDYFIYNPTNTTKRILTHIVPSVSRKSAEQLTRDLEKGNRVTIVKIQSFSVDEINAYHQEETDNYVHY